MGERNFCTDCGSKLVEYETSKFDKTTGERIIGKRCQNLKCENGCCSMTGHRNWSCFRNKCLDCGFVQCDY